MQPSIEGNSIHRRQLDLDDYIQMVRRNKGWLLGPAFVGLVIAVVVAFMWPDTYVSMGSVRVVPPQVSERFIASNVNTNIAQRINSMTQVIMGRNALTNLIQTYGLYPRERKTLPMEDVIEKMRESISIGSITNVQRSSRDLTAFQVSFAYEDRIKAQKVVADLITRFIDENIRARSNQSVLTTQFMKDQWEAAKKEVDEIERKLSEFRAANGDRLPEQVESNLQQLRGIELALANVQSNINRAGMDKLRLESSLETLKRDLVFFSKPPQEGGQPAAMRPKDPRLIEAEKRVNALRASLTGLRDRYSENHPDVRTLQSQLNLAEAERQSLLAEFSAPVSAPQAARGLDAETIRQIKRLEAEIAKVNSEIQVRDLEMEEGRKRYDELSQKAQEYQEKLRGGPVNDADYMLLLQDRELAQKRYNEFDAKHAQSEMATDLENRRASELLELLDAASLPRSPTSPKRPVIIAVGLMIGLAAGFGLVLLREMRDASLKNLKDVRTYTQLNVLASIPLLENDLVVKRRRRLHALAWLATCIVGLSIMGGSIAYYYITKT